MTIGQRIRAARESKGMTLDEVARCCNTTKQTIFKYENGIVTNIPYEKIALLSKTLDVSPSYLFGWAEKETPVAPEYDEGTKKLIDAIVALPPEKKKALADLMGIHYE